jgi:WD40 repeat protein
MSPLRTPALFLCALLLVLCRSSRGDENLEIADFKARAGAITATGISRDGKLVFTGEDDGLVTLWSVTTGTSVHTYSGHARTVFAAALLPDGKRGVTCGDDNLVIIWDLATGKRLHEMRTEDSIPLVMSCTQDGALAATGCDDGQIIIWDLTDGRRLTTLRRRAALCSVLFSPDGKVLAAGYADGDVVVWNRSDWTEQHTLAGTDGASVGALGFSRDGRLLATGNQNGAGFVWNVADGTQVSHFAGYANPEVSPNPPVAPVFPGSAITPENRSSIVFVCMSPDGLSVLASIQDEAPRFWDAKTGAFLGTGDWYQDTRFYVARYGFTFATAAVTPRLDFVVTLKDNLAQVWRMSFVPKPPEQ